MNEMIPTFEYLPLRGPGFIQVLYIKPLSEGEDEDKEIAVYIVEVSLTAAKEIIYTAVSYC